MKVSWLKMSVNFLQALVLIRIHQAEGADLNLKKFPSPTGGEKPSKGNKNRNSVFLPDNSDNLMCHQCHSFSHGDKCVHLDEFSNDFVTTCPSPQDVCVVKQFSYTENATSVPTIWSVERNCSSQCEPGYIVLGERTKLYVSISCCDSHLCNTGNEASSIHLPRLSQLFLFLVLAIIIKL